MLRKVTQWWENLAIRFLHPELFPSEPRAKEMRMLRRVSRCR